MKGGSAPWFCWIVVSGKIQLSTIESAGARTDDEVWRGLAARCRRERARIALGPVADDDLVEYLRGES
jgi:hypothetical protein